MTSRNVSYAFCRKPTGEYYPLVDLTGKKPTGNHVLRACEVLLCEGFTIDLLKKADQRFPGNSGSALLADIVATTWQKKALAEKRNLYRPRLKLMRDKGLQNLWFDVFEETHGTWEIYIPDPQGAWFDFLVAIPYVRREMHRIICSLARRGYETGMELGIPLITP